MPPIAPKSKWCRARRAKRSERRPAPTSSIADPPRKGLDRELLEHLVDEPSERFVYVSCGLESFLEDTKHLTSRGRLRLQNLAAFNLMPFTEHVETVACFERA